MNTQSNAASMPPLDSERTRPPAMSSTRLFYWSVRREIWENRSIYIAPLAAAAVYMLGFSISLIRLPQGMRKLSGLDLTQQRAELAQPYAHAGMLLALVAFVVGIFYSLDSLHGERRDRSILFWKSLPVSDLITVLSKASIPIVILPIVVFASVFVMQLIIFFLSTAVLEMSGVGPATLWTKLPLFQMQLGILYELIVIALWHAPIYGWMILVSSWARRAAFLWAVLPVVVISVVEAIAFHTHYLATLLIKDRVFGFDDKAFNLIGPNGIPIDPHFIPLAQFTPGRFLSSPGLWIGLLSAAVFLAAAVRLRRSQGPI